MTKPLGVAVLLLATLTVFLISRLLIERSDLTESHCWRFSATMPRPYPQGGLGYESLISGEITHIDSLSWVYVEQQALGANPVILLPDGRGVGANGQALRWSDDSRGRAVAPARDAPSFTGGSQVLIAHPARNHSAAEAEYISDI